MILKAVPEKKTGVIVIAKDVKMYSFFHEKEWRIPHGLGTKVLVQTYTEDNGQIFGDVTQTEDEVTITFGNTPMSGCAVIVKPKLVQKFYNSRVWDLTYNDAGEACVYVDVDGSGEIKGVVTSKPGHVTVEFSHPVSGDLLLTWRN